MTGGYTMATRPKTGAVDRLLDQAQEARAEMHGDTQTARNHMHAALHELAKAWNAMTLLEGGLSGADETGEGGGELFVTLAEIRELPAVRRARWDGTERRRAHVEVERAYAEAAAGLIDGRAA